MENTQLINHMSHNILEDRGQGNYQLMNDEGTYLSFIKENNTLMLAKTTRLLGIDNSSGQGTGITLRLAQYNEGYATLDIFNPDVEKFNITTYIIDDARSGVNALTHYLKLSNVKVNEVDLEVAVDTLAY